MAWPLQVGSDVGLFSLVTILMVIAIGFGFRRLLRGRMAENQRNDGAGG